MCLQECGATERRIVRVVQPEPDQVPSGDPCIEDAPHLVLAEHRQAGYEDVVCLERRDHLAGLHLAGKEIIRTQPAKKVRVHPV